MKFLRDNSSIWFTIILLNSEMLKYCQLGKPLDWSWRNSVTRNQGDRNDWCISKDISKCWQDIELKGSSLFKQGMQNQLISEEWIFLYVFLSRLLQAIWIPLSHGSKQIVPCLLDICHMGISHYYSNGLKQYLQWWQGRYYCFSICYTMLISWIVLPKHDN